VPFEADVVTKLLAELLAAFLSHPPGGGAGGKTARLEDGDTFVVGKLGIE
jgi:hypothetical protein